MGVNGAGKSTLLRALSGVHTTERGSIAYGGLPISAWHRHKGGREWVTYMPQSLDLPPRLSALQFVSYVTWLRGYSGEESHQFALDALDKVLLGGVRDVRLGSLSGGMLRRVALAQAISGNPRVLLLDEPSTGLDPEQRRIMVDILRGLDESLVVMSSHVMEDLADVVDQVLVLHEGSLVFQGSVEQLSEKAPKDSRNDLESGFLTLIGSL